MFLPLQQKAPKENSAIEDTPRLPTNPVILQLSGVNRVGIYPGIKMGNVEKKAGEFGKHGEFWRFL